MYGRIMQVLTQYLLLPLFIKAVEFLKFKLEKHFENKKLEEENKKKGEEFKNSESESEVQKSFRELP